MNCAELMKAYLELQEEVKVLRRQGWFEWSGGERPVAGDTLVIVKFRGGGNSKDLEKAKYHWWLHDGSRGDIIAYKIIEED